MLTLFAWLGRAAWPLLGSLVPGISPRLVMVALGALAVLVVVGGPAGAVWLHMNGKAKGMKVAADMACEFRISTQRTEAAESMAHLLGIINSLPVDEPKTDAEEAALCKKSKLCRGAK